MLKQFAFKFAFIGFLLCLSAMLLSCTTKQSYLVSCIDDSEIRAEQKTLVELLNSKETSPEAAFTLKKRIALNLEVTDNVPALLAFLTEDAISSEEDPYTAWWLLMAANIYLKQNSPETATYYFEQILDNYEDLTIKGSSVYQICLQNLIEMSREPENLIKYYTDYIEKFPQDKNIPEFYFMLARCYEQIGEWELSLQSYKRFLEFEKYDIVVQGILDSYAYAKQLIDYSNSSKDWTFASLDELVKSVKAAIDSYSPDELEKYRAKVNFFAKSWEQSYTSIGVQESQKELKLRDFMRGNRITYNASLDSSSTPYEAYLRTSGWNQYVSVWYLYFRKVNFPADDNIHGRWEWAGIYYGEKI